MTVIALLLSYNISIYSTAVAPKYNHNVIIIWSNIRVLLCDFVVEVSGFVLKGKSGKSGNLSSAGSGVV